MKNILYTSAKSLILILTGALVLGSCSEEFLKPDPLSFYEPVTTFSTESGLQSTLAYADRHLRTYWTNYQGMNLATPIYSQYMETDLNVASKTDQSTIWADIATRLTPTDGLGGDDSEVNQLGYFWGQSYTGIKAANTVVSYIDKVSGLSEQTKNMYLGRAYFHRSFRYLTLAFMFRDVPFVTKIISGPKFDYKSTKREAILEKLTLDMEFAVKWVPDQKDMAYVGPINKGACRMLLSKLYLSTGQWDKAKAQCDTIINNSGYSLMTSTFGTFYQPFNTTVLPITRNVIWDLHRPENKLIAANKEVIFGMPNRGVSANSFIPFNTMRALGPLWNDASNLKTPDGKTAINSYARSNTSNYNVKYDYNRALGRGIGYVRPTYFAQYGLWQVNGVNDDGDLRHSSKAGNWTWMDSLRVNDKTSTYFGQYVRKAWSTDTIRNWYGWPHYKIYLSDYNAESLTSSTQYNGASSSATTNGNADWYFYRLAEAYLLRAEAKYYSGDATAAADVNQVRQRAQCKQLYSSVTIGDIMNERARELYLEEWRYFELSRVSYCLALSGKPDEWGNTYNVNTYDKQQGTDATGGSYWYQRITHYNNFYNKNSALLVKGRAYTIDKHNLYLPIPQSAIDANRMAKLSRNYGYDGYDASLSMWGTWQEATADEDKTE
jgi:SusD family.